MAGSGRVLKKSGGGYMKPDCPTWRGNLLLVGLVLRGKLTLFLKHHKACYGLSSGILEVTIPRGKRQHSEHSKGVIITSC